ncbi:MAG: glucose/mannose-6-phosphate isomerase [Candidatus Saccharimonadales bacterium]|jgi:glucose/mannose-6-phosphate isomerase
MLQYCYTKAMLDDLKYIHNKDAQDALGIAAKQWQQLSTTYDLPDMNFDVSNIVFAGMGGSALAALISISWPAYDRPFEIWRRYGMPKYVSKDTLVIVSSYSGNTEETLSSLEAAEIAGAHIAVIASGGKLADAAVAKGYPLARLPEVSQPRFGALSSLKAIVTILEKVGIVSAEDSSKAIATTAKFLENQIANWLPEVPTSKNPAKQLALEVAGTTPVIYGGHEMYSAAYKWKISFNENAKNVAWCNEIPEFSHNEFLGWTSHPVDKPYSVIDLRSSFEHPRIQKRFEVTDRLLSGQRPAAHVVDAVGDTKLEHLLYCVAYGDFVSLYTALLNGLNPSPVDLIEKMKKSLDDTPDNSAN